MRVWSTPKTALLRRDTSQRWEVLTYLTVHNIRGLNLSGHHATDIPCAKLFCIAPCLE